MEHLGELKAQIFTSIEGRFVRTQPSDELLLYDASVMPIHRSSDCNCGPP